MFRRTLQIDVVKPKKAKDEDNPDEPEKSVEDILPKVQKVINKTLFGIGCVICTYVFADTVRKVVVEASKQ